MNYDISIGSDAVKSDEESGAVSVVCVLCGAVIGTENLTSNSWNLRFSHHCKELEANRVSQWLQDNGYEEMSKSIDFAFEQ